jgi:hypothetical protein
MLAFAAFNSEPSVFWLGSRYPLFLANVSRLAETIEAQT